MAITKAQLEPIADRLRLTVSQVKAGDSAAFVNAAIVLDEAKALGGPIEPGARELLSEISLNVAVVKGVVRDVRDRLARRRAAKLN